MGICTNSLGVELARRADIVGVAERLGARLKKSGGEWIGPCPVCGGRDRFAINPRKGLFNCRGCGIGGDAIALVMHAEGCDFRKAVERLTDVRWRPLERGEAHLAATLAEVAQRVVTPQSEAEERAEAFACREREAIVRELRPLLDSPGERYFRETRNIDIETIADVLERTDAIGWHPSVRFHQPDPNKPLNEHHGKQFGCIVGVMTDAITAEPTGGISRTYITADSRKLCKAKSWGPVGITRLDGDAAVTYGLGLAEGLETTLSAMSRGFRPCWSIGGKSIMAAFPVLPAIESLTVFADNDPDGGGLRAAQEAQARWRAAGREARVRMTAKPGDLNDVRDRGAA